MKTFYIISMIALISILSSCSHEDNMLSPSTLFDTDAYSVTEIQQAKALALPVSELHLISDEIRQKREAAIILADYVVLKDNKYSLEISETIAKELGVPSHIYKDIANDLLYTNKIIQESLDDGEILELPDIKTISKAYKKNELYLYENGIDIEVKPNASQEKRRHSGYIMTNDQGNGEDSFITDREYVSVIFRCHTAAALVPIYRCTVKAYGGTKFASKVGSLFTTTTVDVPIPASGSMVACTLTFATSDSNGGSCVWEASKY